MTDAPRTRRSRRPATTVLSTLATLTLALAACAGPVPSADPSIPASVAPPPSTVPTAVAQPSASAAPTPIVTPAPTAASTPLPSTACAPISSSGELPSDRFTDLVISSGAAADRLTFAFGDPSLPGPPVRPEGRLEVAEPPYSSAGSGEPIDMIGDHVAQIRFSGMSLSNDVGQETYDGPREFTPDLPALRHVVLYDVSEGVVGWYIGYDGSGCVTLTRNGDDITVDIDHP